MINSLELYKEALTFAKNNPNAAAVPVLKNFYLQLMTMTFYELTTKKTSPLISTLCRVNNLVLPTKNFSLEPVQVSFNLYTSFDLFTVVYGLNVALAENLESCLNVFASNAERIFHGVQLSNEGLQPLQKNLIALDEGLGKFCAGERIIEKRIEVPVERIVEKRVEVSIPTPQANEQDKELLQSLKTFADNRRTDDEKIIDEIKKVQLALQDELPRLQGTLKTISDIRDGLDFKTLEEPINQLVQLFDMINETAQRHPQPDTQKGYDKLIKRCKSFARYVEQSLAMLGAELINETDIPLDTSRHKVTNTVRPSNSAKVAKVLNVGLIYKGRVLRKAEVEIVEPAAQSTNNATRFGNFFGR